MEIKQNARVETAAGENVGSVDRVVVSPSTGEVTHLVVRKGFILTEDRVVPMDWIAEAGDDTLQLRPDIENLDELPPFEETHYVQAESGQQSLIENPTQAAPPFYWYPPVIGFRPTAYTGTLPYGYPGPGYIAETERNIPRGTVALKQGAQATARDGESVGTVVRLITAGEDDQATHLVVEAGLLAKTRRLIPAHWVVKVEEDEIHLAVNARVVENLPEYED